MNLDTWVISEFDSEQVKNTLNSSLEPLVILPVGQNDGIHSVSLRIKELDSINDEKMTVEEAIAQRKSVRDYVSGEIPFSIISDILNDSTAIPYFGDHKPILDLRLVVGEVEGMATGIYQYNLLNNSLNQYRQNDSRSLLRSAALNQPWVETAQLDLVISANTSWIDNQVDPSLSHRIIMFNIGQIFH